VSEKIEAQSELAIEVGGTYVTRTYSVIGPIECIDCNGWAWFKGRCWNASNGTYYANQQSPHDLVASVMAAAA
jgi:hypothetical protein